VKRDISTELKVGVAVIISAAILIFGIIWVKNYKFNVQRYTYSVLFPNVGSLEVGDPVSVLGVKKGEVKKIVLVDDNVLVTFDLTKDVLLQSDARFTVMNVGLMGERFINISPGVSSEQLNLNIPVHGYYDTGIPEVMGMMGAAIDEVRHLVAVLQGTVATPAFTTAITDIVNNLQKISVDWQTITAENKGKMTEAIENLSVSSSKLRGLIDNNEDKFKNTMTNLNEGSEKFAALAGRLDTLSSSVHYIVNELQAGKGTVGRALKNDSLYNQLLGASTNLDSLITDFKKHPKKYIHFSVF
jgi:phospholipid/cholesterol/gamma-HCH transport system substrate-binding protein